MNQRQNGFYSSGRAVARAGILAASIAALAVQSAAANTIVDLRFDPSDPGYVGPKSVITNANTDYLVQVWVQVFGTNTISTDDGVRNVAGSIQSIQVSGGGALVGGSGVGVTGTGIPANLSSFWSQSATQTGNPGSVQNITTDSIQDWGPAGPVVRTNDIVYASTSLTTANYITTAGLPAGTFHSLNAGGTDAMGNVEAAREAEFEVGIFTVHLGAITGPGDTDFAWVKNTKNGITAAFGSARDSSSVNEIADANYLNSSTSPAVTPALTDVAFNFVPEPSTFILAACGAIGALAARRKRS